tara:strand:- start:22736 stop:23617 length:882 start_codon:yes stop_codon:yes gene_type:complete
MVAKQQHYSPKQVAEALAVSESSVKRWCDNRRIPAVLTCGGHRRISLSALYQFLEQSNRAIKHPEALGLPALCSNREMHIPGADQPVCQEFRDALVAGRESTCREIVRRQRSSGKCPSAIAQSLLTDAMHAIGNAWKCQSIDPYQERRASEICQRIVRELLDELGPIPETAPVAIGGTPSGDPYQLPTAMVELTLRELGWNAASLGNDLPLTCMRQAVHDFQPRMVWISVSYLPKPADFVAAERAFAESLPDDVVLIIGGRALNDTIRPKLLYTAYCDSLGHLGELAKAFASA